MSKHITSEDFTLPLEFITKSSDSGTVKINIEVVTHLVDPNLFKQKFILEPFKFNIKLLAEHLSKLDELKTLVNTESANFKTDNLWAEANQIAARIEAPLTLLLQERGLKFVRIERVSPMKENSMSQSSFNKGFNWMYLSIALVILLVLTGGGLGFDASNLSSKLDNTRNTLSSTQAQLSSTQTQLATTQSQLTAANTNLASTQAQLSQTQTTLASTQSQLTTTANKLSSTEDALNTSQTALTAAQSQLSSMQSQLSSANSSLQTEQGQVTSLQNQLAAKQLKYFANEAALQTWLTSQPLFTSSDVYNDEVNLTNLALDAGYVANAILFYDSNGKLYTDCEVCCADGNVYFVFATTHQVTFIYNDGVQPTP
jgi:myosin heavy subunit